METRVPDPHEMRRLAAEACVDATTARRFYEGRPVRSTTKARILRAIEKLGLPAASAQVAE
jgi:DNA-binding LacI/PurR family transcriptional regulator